MQYSEGNIGRVFVLRFEDGDDIIEGITNLASQKGISAASINLIGAMRTAGFVSGPKEPVIPPVPMWDSLSTPHEVFGMGTIFLKEGQPTVHIHGGLFLDKAIKGGCIRKDTTTFMLIEAVIMELLNIRGERKVSPVTGMAMLELG